LPVKKLLVWDGDETLWRGTMLEGDTPTLPDGRAALCAELCERGVLQSVASTNLLADVKAALHGFDLDRFFLSPQADLERSKPEMIKAIMDALGLVRNEDVVFLDDQASHREEVVQALDGITVGGPEDVDEILRHFEKNHYTEEDRHRVRRYQAEQVRQQAAAAYDGDHLVFLRTTNLELELSRPSDAQWSRVVDLVARSNRFSAMDGEWNADQLAEAREQESLVAGVVKDRFGSYGLSTVMALGDAEVRLLVVSCRLQGKGIGSALVGWAINQHVGDTLTATWRETQYNAGVRALYEWYDFEFNGASDGWVTARKRVNEAVELPDWVTLVDSSDG
jgi:methoxymalonate biosynthesis protein